MAERPVTWISLNDSPSGSPSRDKPHVKRGKKNKPPNLTLDDQINILAHREHTIHGYHMPHRSPPFSPKSPLTSDFVYHYPPDGTASPLSPYKEITSCPSPEAPSSPRSLKSGWQQQPKKRSLTPIPEMKLNDKMLNLNMEHDNKRKPDFIREICVPDYNLDDIKVIVGRNKIRIIGEPSQGAEVSTADCEMQKEVHKVVNIPSHIDPKTIKVMKQGSQVVIHGYQYPLQIRSSSVGENGFLTTQDNGSVRITVNVPKSYDPHHVQIQTVTRHYLVVTASHTDMASSRSDKEQHSTKSHDVKSHDTKTLSNGHSGEMEDFVETYELPDQPHTSHIVSKVVGQHTVVVEVPLGFRERKSTM